MIATTLFEHTANFDEKTYRGIWVAKPVRWYRFTIITAVGIILLFWSYTLIIGVLILGLSLIAFVSPRILGKGLRHNYYGHKYLHQPLTYGVSEDHLWVRGKNIEASATWTLLATWQVRADWLILTASGIPQVFLPVSDMKKVGSFERIMQLALENGKKFK